MIHMNNSPALWLYARDYKSREELWKFVKELEEAGERVVVDDNWEIIYETKK